MEYVDKRCPYCKYKYLVRIPKNQKIYGCPVITCKSCGQQFFDKDYIEPGLRIVGANYPDKTFSWNWTLFIFDGLFVAYDYNMPYLHPLEYLIGSILIILTIHSVINTLDQRNTYKINLAKAKTDYQESLNRLSNKEYLLLLQKNGVEIPNKFLQ
ncbi:Rcat domain-containing protein [Dielma fastidiosa]|uniref:Uncharacterized protein n=1 Tax=Dielma fastidiosa TaxID=1034346 RepID=A0A318L3G1_9FIRM|nr:hypothetical protein [Dielma fastidiosa]PXX75302.1 hypothetical protein DES51_11832 [Dielma fastidiosa]